VTHKEYLERLNTAVRTSTVPVSMLSVSPHSSLQDSPDVGGDGKTISTSGGLAVNRQQATGNRNENCLSPLSSYHLFQSGLPVSQLMHSRQSAGDCIVPRLMMKHMVTIDQRLIEKPMNDASTQLDIHGHNSQIIEMYRLSKRTTENKARNDSTRTQGCQLPNDNDSFKEHELCSVPEIVFRKSDTVYSGTNRLTVVELESKTEDIPSSINQCSDDTSTSPNDNRQLLQHAVNKLSSDISSSLAVVKDAANAGMKSTLMPSLDDVATRVCDDVSNGSALLGNVAPLVTCQRNSPNSTATLRRKSRISRDTKIPMSRGVNRKDNDAYNPNSSFSKYVSSALKNKEITDNSFNENWIIDSDLQKYRLDAAAAAVAIDKDDDTEEEEDANSRTMDDNLNFSKYIPLCSKVRCVVKGRQSNDCNDVMRRRANNFDDVIRDDLQRRDRNQQMINVNCVRSHHDENDKMSTNTHSRNSGKYSLLQVTEYLLIYLLIYLLN